MFGLISSIFYVFATQQRFLSPVQLLVNNELFHQSSFYLKILFYHSSFYCNNVICIFLPGEKSEGKCPWGNVLDPCLTYDDDIRKVLPLVRRSQEISCCSLRLVVLLPVPPLSCKITSWIAARSLTDREAKLFT